MRETSVTLVTQILPADCGICCIAMASNVKYLDVLVAAKLRNADDWFCGITFQQLINTMRRVGMRPRWHWPEKLSPKNVGAPLRERARGKTAIHLVPSKNVEDDGASHYVLVMEDGTIYDPSPDHKLKYEHYDELESLGVAYVTL